MAVDLLPCPLCGGEPFMDAHWSVCCNNIDCQCSTMAYNTEDEAIAAWNRRALPPTVAGEVAWQWSDFSGKWYTVDTARLTIAEQEELARAIAKDHEGRVRPLYASPSDASNLTAGDGWKELRDELLDFHDCLDGGGPGDGRFRIVGTAPGEEEQTRMNLRAVLREAAAALSAFPKPQATPGREAVEGELLAMALRIDNDGTPSQIVGADELRALASRLAAPSQPSRNEVIEAFNWALDEVDVLSNKISGFAYPQGMGFVDRRGQLDNYRKAVDARRAAIRSIKEGEAK